MLENIGIRVWAQMRMLEAAWELLIQVYYNDVAHRQKSKIAEFNLHMNH